jgi:phospholipid/cholesterol/gamma-HCH transport system substrate-binding protein
MKFSTEAKVGLVILAAALFLTYLTFTVGGWKWGAEKGYRIDAVFDSVAGLDPKSPVKLAGVGVGKVDSISLQDSRASVVIRIFPDIKIPKGSKAVIRATGLLGEKYLEIVPGKGPGFMAPGDTVAETAGSADMEALIAKLGEIDVKGLVDKLTAIATDIKYVSASLRGALGTPEGEQSLKDIVASIRDLSRNLSAMIKENRENLTKTVSNFESFSKDVKENTPEILKRIDAITSKLDTIAGRLEQGQGTLGKLLTEEEVYTKLDSALGGLDKLSTSLSEGKGTIGKLLTDDAAYNQLTKTLEGLGEAVSAIQRFHIFVGVRNEYQLREGENKGYFTVKIQPRKNKYYLVELVDDPRGEVHKTVTQIDNGTPQEKLTTRRRLKFSAEFARRFADLTLRAGLMENTFGVGADYGLFSDRLQFSFDAWDFSSDDPESDRVRLKVTGRLMPVKYLFVQGGYDNFLNDRIDTYFVGGGLVLQDDDLKYLLGNASIPIK